MSTNPKCGREALRARFADAAKSVTELYRTAVVSYDAGYRDALLFVHRYILLDTPAAMTTDVVFPHSGQPPAKTANPLASARSPDAERLLRFIQNTLKRHEAVLAASRGMSRRRKRSPGWIERSACGVYADGESSTMPDGGRGAPCRRTSFSARVFEDSGAEVHDMLSNVRIAHPAESDSGISDDEFAAEQ
ncbi:hypothetical protein BCY84_00751 [Trypanosoma cruzi cruzi]|nr:hypothetical protein TcBrA4_0120540 [Trypanosoma cruzi]PBJ81037.1 hypothetical protein BCY84_00751 [Trypanosoma cruzi cruzi]PWU86276.1 hypothetical protein C4B63_127g57 [Trypanosoma cruzi]PWU87441.1 hypothetical protein C4B63_92g52 [Trypanosoma cruzi]